MASFFPRQALEGAGGHGSLDLHILQRQITGSLITLQCSDLGHDLPELLHTGALVPQDTQLVLEQRVIQNMDFAVKHLKRSPFYFDLASRSSRSRSA